MANTKKYVSLDKLGLYDEKIKGVISAGDAKALEDAKKYVDGLAVNYDAAGSAATAEANAKAYADGKDTAIAEAKKAGTDAAAAAKAADDKAVAAQGEVDALETYVGTFTHDTAKTVVEYINAKTDGIATSGNLEALGARVTTVEGKVATIEGDYLKGTDKTELEGAIDTVSAAVERLTNGVSAEEIDGVNDLIQYVKDHGTEVTGMQDDISENATAIAGVAGRMDTAEGKITTLEGSVATKVEQTAFDEAIEALEGVDAGQETRIAALEAKFGGADGSVEDMIADAKAEAIATAAGDATTKANTAESNAKGYTDSEIDKVEGTISTLQGVVDGKAEQSDLEALAGRVTTAEGEIDTLQSEMDAVEAKALANEGAISTLNTTVAGKAAQSDLTAVGDRVTAIETWHANFVEVSEEEINGLFA